MSDRVHVITTKTNDMKHKATIVRNRPIPVSALIKARLKQSKTSNRYFSNDNISHAIQGEDELERLVDEVAAKMKGVMSSLIIDTKNDHNSKDTARRFAKMLVMETFGGRYVPEPDVTEFPNVNQVDELYVVGPIKIRSACAHHLVPITGQVWVGVLPQDKLIGLSKFHRTAQHIASRPQIQEEMTAQIADRLEQLTTPKGLAVLVRASHLCCGHRGVKDDESLMMTSVMRGEMRTNSSLKDEFFKLVSLTDKASK